MNNNKTKKRGRQQQKKTKVIVTRAPRDDPMLRDTSTTELRIKLNLTFLHNKKESKKRPKK